MSGWLLDTNVLSELRRPRPEQHVVAFVAAQPLASLCVSTVTLAELRYGVGRVKDPARRRELGAWLDHRVRPMFEQRVLPISEDVMVEWRILVEQGRKAGHTHSQPDLIIAATARLHDMTVVSRDRTEYERARVPVLSPWAEA